MNKIKNQHYVPRFYLKNFINSKDKVFVYDKFVKRVFESKVKNIANENYFYDIDLLDEITGVDQFLEKYFHPLESKISKLLVELIEDLKNKNFIKLSRELKAELAIYLTYQHLRTREQREQMRQMIDSLTNAIGKIQLDELGHSDNNFVIDIDDAKFQASMILDRNNVEEIANILNNHIWIVLENKTDYNFYTSDHPLVRRGHIKRPGMSMNGLASEGIEIAFPISPDYLILLVHRESFDNYLKYEDQIVGVNDPQNVVYYNSL
jgi:hypothetical protein